MKTNSYETFSQILYKAVCSCFIFAQFRFATCLEKFLVVIGLISASLAGMCVPVIIILYGRMADVFIQFEIQRLDNSSKEVSPVQQLIGRRWIDNEPNTREQLTESTIQFAIYTAILGTAQFVFGAIFVTALNIASEKQVLRLRYEYLKALLTHDVGWFDLQAPRQLSLNTILYINRLHEGLGEKLGILTHTFVSTLTCLIVAALYGWLLTVVLLSIVPIICFISAISMKIGHYLKSQEEKAYALSESLAEDTLINIRSVAVYQAEKVECRRYVDSLEESEMASVHTGSFHGAISGFMWLIMYCGYALAFYYGMILTLDDKYPEYTPPVLLIVFFNVQIGVVNLMQIPDYVKIMYKAKQAAEEVFAQIDRVEPLSTERSSGLLMSDMKGNISFNNVHFCYPSNPSNRVLQGINFQVDSGEIAVVVGFSGVGKTTCMRLLNRLYDAQLGSISLDNVNIRKLSLPFLRNAVGFVQQRTVLFGITIADAISCGLINISLENIIEIAKVVDAHDVITKLPRAYQSPLLRVELSDETKQRLAIARVLLRNPQILILDNACSCLSPEDELKLVQNIKKYRKNQTLVIVTARLPTMKFANLLLHLVRGVVQEEGSFLTLMANKGDFYNVIMRDYPISSHVTSSTKGNINSFDSVSNQRMGHMIETGQYDRTQRVHHLGDEYVDQHIVHVSRFPTFLNISDKPVMDGVDEYEMRKFSWTKILKFNVKEWPFLMVGCVAATITGFSLPAYAVLFGECLGAIALQPVSDLDARLLFFTQMFLVAGFLAGVALLVQGYMLAISGSKLTRRLRRKTFDAILRQDMAWFDVETNDLNNLLQLLRVDAVNARAAAGPRLTALTQGACVLVVCTGLSLYYNWKLGLAITCFVPFMLAALLSHSRMVVKHTVFEISELRRSKDIANEAISNIKIVSSLGLEHLFLQKYWDELKRVHLKFTQALKPRGIIYGLAICTPSYAYAACFYYGGLLIEESQLPFQGVFKVAEALILGSIMAAQLVASAPNTVKAQMSATKLLQLLKRKPNVYSPTVVFQNKWKTHGQIKFRAVSFQHPLNRSLPKLKAFSLQMKEGQTLALVGQAGCGKSVPIQLLLRFYNTTSGTVLLDDRDIGGINLCTLRSQIGLVDGDPIFFQRSIAENIAYGDNSRLVHMDDIMAAAKEANIHNYIATLQDGYATQMNQDLLNMTYGQKVRLSLARALLRDPPILLLENLKVAEDEDAEMLVEGAIKRACMGRSCILVSQYIKSAIRNADVICVMRDSKIVEEGTHHGLMESRGLYYHLYCHQELLIRRTESELLRNTVLSQLEN